MRDQSIDVLCHLLDQLQQSAGRMATISTHHAPWPLEAKHQPMLHPASGMPGLETFLQVMFTEAQDHGFPCPKWSSAYSGGCPAELFGLGGRKGRLLPGLEADVAHLLTREGCLRGRSAGCRTGRRSLAGERLTLTP